MNKLNRCLGMVSCASCMALLLAAPAAPPAAPAPQAAPNVVVVNTDADTVAADGVTSLREAIGIANLDGGPTIIRFNIPGCGGVCTIKPQSQYPDLIESSTTIDGTTQTAFAGDTNPFGPEVELDGSDQDPLVDGPGLQIGFASQDDVIRGLAIHSFPGTGVQLGTSGVNGGNSVEDCYIGTDPTGTIALGNGAQGVAITGFDNVVRGNLIAGNGVTATNTQVLISEQPGGNNLIVSNRIGTDRTGMRALVPLDPTTGFPLSRNGVTLTHTSDNVVENNLISGNAAGVLIGDTNPAQGALPASRNVVRNNLIGTNPTGMFPVEINVAGPYETSGVVIIGSGANGNAILSNTIAFTDLEGVVVSFEASENTISRNRIFSNGRLAIDLAPSGNCCGDGVTANDPGDGDAGGNDLLNFPVIRRVLRAGPLVLVFGSVDTPQPGGMTIELFATEPGGDPSGHGEGMEFLASRRANPRGGFLAVLRGVRRGAMITATATDAIGNTSEFAANVVVR